MATAKFEFSVVVLGMHRSGTSALAGALSHCGFALPRNLLPPREGNERGFFEADVVNNLNSAILSDLGQRWYSLSQIAPDAFDSSGMRRKSEHISSLVSSEYKCSTIPLIKDPRICRLFPLWIEGLERVASQVHLPIIVRSPIEVARSLEHRNQFAIEFGLLLWARYYLDLEWNTRGRRRRFISFDQLMTDWRHAIGLLDLPIDPLAVKANLIDEFLAGELRHHQAEPAATDRYPLIAEVERIILRWTKAGRDEPADFPSLDALRAKLDDMATIVDDLFNKGRLEQKRRVRAATEASEAKADLKRARRSLEDVSDLKQDLKVLLDEQAARRKLDQKLLNELAQAKEHIASVAGKQHKLEADLLQTSAERQALKTALDNAKSAAKDLKTEHGIVKRKYQSSKMMLERERANVQRLRSSNDSANRALAQLKMGWGFRLENRLRAILTCIGQMLYSGGSRRAKRQAELRLIRESNLFDAQWYLQQYQDVATANIDPAQHFIDLGWREGRSASAAFSTARYLKQHADVAALGMNPLLHYLEHGRFEGREYFATGTLGATTITPVAAKQGVFGLVSLPPAAPVFQGNRKPPENVSWLRSCNLRANRSSIIINELGLGVGSQTVSRELVESALADFSILSGKIGDVAEKTLSAGIFPALVDGWFRTSRRLNTRWAVAEATVFRAVQYDPATGHLTIVGEGLASTPLDIVQFELAAPMLPLLMVTCTPNGEITGLTNVAFPSLLRGGHHYAELVSRMADEGGTDPITLSVSLENSLRAVRSGMTKPLVKIINVDLGGADASTPLFQRDLRDMLDRVIGIEIVPAASETTDSRVDMIAAAVALKPLRSRSTGATLTVAADMVPSLSLLVAPTAGLAPSRDLALPITIVEPDASQPAICFVPPAIKGSIPALRSPTHSLPFPRLRGRFTTVPSAAIRTLMRPLDDAELLVPNMALTADPTAADWAIDWLVSPMEWGNELLLQALAALRFQHGIARQRVFLIGDVNVETSEAAKTLFGNDFVRISSRDEGLSRADAPLVGYLGGGVVLHDARTAAILASLAMDRNALSASCVLVRSEKRGKLWKTVPVDAGKLPIDRVLVHSPMAANPVEKIWRATYPVIEPPPGFWLSRRDKMRAWQEDGMAQKGFHFVTSLISASHVIGGDVALSNFAVAPVPSSEIWSLQAKVEIG